MNERLGMDDFTKSQFAIRGYIDSSGKSAGRHKARVLISSKGKTRFNGVLYVSAAIGTNMSFVIVEGNNEFERDFFGKYTNEYQRFELAGKTLLIQAKDRWGNDIQVNITGE